MSESSGSLTDLAAAVDLVRGPFLEGFSLADSVLFDDWQMFQTEAIRRDVMDALSLLTRGYQASGNPEWAIEFAYRWVELDPFNGTANQSVMMLLAETDQPTSALRHFRSYERLLDKEFGIEPDDEVLDLFERIRGGRFALPDSGDSPLGIVDQVVARPDVSDAPKFVLPRQMTSFVGRRQEIDDIGRLLSQEPNCRLVTLTGAGGVGKTRLALSTAQALAHGFADGVFFIPLVGVADVTLVLSSIAQGLNLQVSSRSSLKMQLFSFLRGKSLLLVLDNVEQLLAQQETGVETFPKLVLELLADILDLRLLITSREPLNIQPEWIFSVSGLSYPNSEEPIFNSDRTLERYSAMELFYHRVRRLHVDFDWREEWAAMARICRCVDGLPLAIELAAPWTQSLSCDEIADQIEQDMDLLTTTLRDVEPRHRSIRRVFEQTWQMLSSEEQHVLSRLSVFRNGFTRLASEQVAGATLPLLASLVGKTLLRHGQLGRYDSQELLRQFCADKLASDLAALVRTQDRHAAYFTSLLAHSYDDLLWRRPVETYWALSAEIDNINAAWAWAVDQGDLAALDRAFEVYWQLLDYKGAGDEIIEIFGRSAERLEGICFATTSEENRRRLLLGEVLIPHGQRKAHNRGLQQEGMSIAELGLALIRQAAPTDNRKRFWALIRIGMVYLELDPAKTKQVYEECTRICNESGDRYGLALAHTIAAWHYLFRRDLSEARAHTEHSLRFASEFSTNWWALISLELHAMMMIYEGKYAETNQSAAQILHFARRVENFHYVCNALMLKALTARIVGRFDIARIRCEEALKVVDRGGVPDRRAFILLNLSALSRLMGDFAEADWHLQEAEARFHQFNITNRASLNAERGRLAYAKGEYRDASESLADAAAGDDIWLPLDNFDSSLVVLGDAYCATDDDRASVYYGRALHKSRIERTLPRALQALGGVAHLLARSGELTRAMELALLVHGHPLTWHEHRVRTQMLIEELEMSAADITTAARQRAMECDAWTAVNEVLATIPLAKN